MNVVNNRTMVNKLSQSIIKNEVSSTALVLQTPTVFTTWFTIDSNLSETLRGYKNITDFIGSESTVIYNRVENLPMYGVDNLVEIAQWDEETMGYEEDFQSSGVIYPNTIFPKPNDCFIINDASVPALYTVTDIRPTTVRSNPFIEINFRLLSRDPQVIAQLERQVRSVYTTNMTSMGGNKSLVVSKSGQERIEEHVRAYSDLANFYTTSFYSSQAAAFVFDGMPSGPGPLGKRCTYVDMTLWKFMFDEGIIIYDDLLTYARSNDSSGRPMEPVYTSSPDIYIDDHKYKRSILYRLYDPAGSSIIRTSGFDEYRYPVIWEPTPRITKYQGLNIWYLEWYENRPSNEDRYGDFYLWDDEFLCKIRQNVKYEEIPITGGICYGCEAHCKGAPVTCYNPYLRNAIISYFNGEDIDWDKIQISDARTIENYYLVPLVLGIYKKYIQGLS